MTGLRYFLNISTDFNNKTLPHENAGQLAPNITDCTVYRKIREHFESKNADLVDYINKHPDKPKSERIFPPFSYKICI